MKKIIFLLLTITLFSCKEDNETLEPVAENSELLARPEDVVIDSAAIMLKEFYVKYTKLLIEDKSRLDNEYQELLMHYLSSDLINEMNDPELDYDPFISGNDYDDSILKTMSINKDADKPNAYNYCYKAFYREDVCVTLFIKNIDGKYVIYRIKNFPKIE